MVEIEFVEILEAVSKLVLSVVVLRKGGRADAIVPIKPVNPDPSPTNFAEIVPAEIEEKKP